MGSLWCSHNISKETGVRYANLYKQETAHRSVHTSLLYVVCWLSLAVNNLNVRHTCQTWYRPHLFIRVGMGVQHFTSNGLRTLVRAAIDRIPSFVSAWPPSALHRMCFQCKLQYHPSFKIQTNSPRQIKCSSTCDLCETIWIPYPACWNDLCGMNWRMLRTVEPMGLQNASFTR